MKGTFVDFLLLIDIVPILGIDYLACCDCDNIPFGRISVLTLICIEECSRLITLCLSCFHLPNGQ